MGLLTINQKGERKNENERQETIHGVRELSQFYPIRRRIYSQIFANPTVRTLCVME